jgi:hypothetical protein
MYVIVVIPTTAGPLIVRRLTARQALPASCAFADGDYRPLPWSSDYAGLVGPEGPLARKMPELGKTAYELRLSGSFDAGRSWEVPVALAHVAVAEGHTLTDDAAIAERIIWATGAVDLDLDIIPGDYALVDKLARSKDLFDSAPHAELDIRIPPGREGEAACAHARDMLGLRAGNVRIVSGLMAPRPEVNRPAITPPSRHSGPTASGSRAFGGAILFATLAGGFWFYTTSGSPVIPERERPPERSGLPAPQPPQQSPLPAPINLAIEELRAPANGSCRKLLFGTGQPVISAVAQIEGRFSATSVDRALCGLRYRLNEPGGDRLMLPPELTAITLPSTSVDPAGTQTVFLRENFRQNVVYAVQWIREDSGGRQTRTVQHELRTAGQ